MKMHPNLFIQTKCKWFAPQQIDIATYSNIINEYELIKSCLWYDSFTN